MDTYDIISVVVALLAFSISVGAFTLSKRRHHHALEGDLRKEYLSPQMHQAVRRLWQFYNLWGTNFVNRYEEKRKEEDAQIAGLEPQMRIVAEQATLHYQRKLVSHFYQYVAALYRNKTIPNYIVFGIWSKSDLEIIPKIIIPIENKLRESLNTPPLLPLDDNCGLLTLYRDATEQSREPDR
jgi:hypothetical protein